MIEPFIWMFKTENFKQRFWQLIAAVGVFIFLFCVINFISCFFSQKYLEWFIYLDAILIMMLVFFVQGYFWELTSNVINREIDIEAGNIYSGKIKNIFRIEIPEFRPLKFIWRGFASAVASLLMFVPLFLLSISSIYTSNTLVNIFRLNTQYLYVYTVCYCVLFVSFFLIMPALLWNYAKQNSVVAVWNFRKALYIVESYPLRYIGKTSLFMFYYSLNFFIAALLSSIFSITLSSISMITTSFLCCVVATLFLFIVFFIYIYNIHVYAYLLGTLTPYTEC